MLIVKIQAEVFIVNVNQDLLGMVKNAQISMNVRKINAISMPTVPTQMVPISVTVWKVLVFMTVFAKVGYTRITNCI